FYPLFLTTSHRHDQDYNYYQILEEICTRNISPATLQKNEEKIRNPSLQTPINTTHIVSFRSIADNINRIACSFLPFNSDELEPIILIAVDYINNQKYDLAENNHNF
ncbi:8517_t:CDS:1, partial [Racocetra fulgida]